MRLHACGVAHLDISLENVLCRARPHFEAVLIDFETAEAGGRRLVLGSVGKPQYRAPEMWGGEPWDTFSADFFACGVVAYALAVGRHPWDSTKPGTCHRFGFFATRGLPAFLRTQQVIWRNSCTGTSAAECLSPRMTALLQVLLSLRPALREAAVAFTLA
uniref:non-specific serine/threonine protein kinase n=1 Tax=Pyrodinium bahamense TaxID=73915 RepID=A0A7S0BAH7_9DINO